MKERLQKLLAQANIGSRRASEELISAGRVRVNGAVAQLGDKADPASDIIEVDGARLKFEAQEPIYIMLNKPKQVLSTDKPHRGDKRETVSGLLHRHEHLFSIGRLDADSEGLVVMTNDGDLAQKLSHPRYRHTKTYRVEVLGLPTAETVEKWQQGVFLEDGRTAPCFVEIVKGSVKGTILRVVMTEGKKRQIRRVAALLGHPVRRLTRTHIGMLALGDLESGQSRELTAKEVVALKTPAPEIKQLRAQGRRRPVEREAAPTEEPRADRRRPTRAGYDEEVPRPRGAEIDGDVRPNRRRSRTKSDGEVPQRRTSRVKPAGAVEETPRPRRTRSDEPSAEAPRKRPARRVRKNDSPDDAPDKHHAPRAGAPETSEDAPKKRPVRRGRNTDLPDNVEQKRRTPHSKRPITSGGSMPTARKRKPGRKPRAGKDSQR